MKKRKNVETYKFEWLKIKSNKPLNTEQIITIFQIIDESIYLNKFYSNINIAREVYYAIGNSIKKVNLRCWRNIFNLKIINVSVKLTWKNV